MQEGDSAKRHLVCTVITPNYLSQLLVLGESIASVMPEVDLRVLVLQDCGDLSPIQSRIDEYVKRAGPASSHRAVSIDDCDWGDFDVESAALFYTILEFATSVKPAFMRSLLRQGWDRVTYLDPDIRVFADFGGLLDEHADLSLTPHFFTDIPRDGRRPSTYSVLMAGVFNLGFCSARPSAMPFLDWWSAQLQFECLNNHLAGHFTDQKVMDMAQLMAKVQVLTEPGLNVAYWNLHERRVVEQGEGWAVQAKDRTEPLYFFHFSGFQLGGGASLSLHSSRAVLGEAVPRRFVTQYEDQRCAIEDESPYPFTLGGARLAEPIPVPWNHCIREDAEVHVRAGVTLRQVREQIYAPSHDDADSVCRACGDSHDHFGARVSRFLEGWSCHPSLVGVPNGVSAFFRTDRFEYRASAMDQLWWASTGLTPLLSGVDGLAREILRVAREAARGAVDLELVGYLSSPVGIGQIARWTLATLESAGMRPALGRVYAIDDAPEYLSALLRRRNPMAASNASVIGVVNADQWVAHVTGPAMVNPAIQHVEAVWAWELDHVPESMYETAANGGVSRVHALSHWSARAMAKVLSVPVHRFTPFDVELIDRWRDRATASRSSVSSPYLLTTFDAKSHLSRKNPEGVLELWRRIEADYPNHRLIIKSTDLRDVAPDELMDLIDGSPRTELIDEHLTDDAYTDLVAQCAVFVSLHRSEGLGLTPIEAGLSGRPVVYTNYGGVVDFMSDGFFPVSYTSTRVGDNRHVSGPYDADAWWAEPDMDDAERQVRRALEAEQDDGPDATLLLDQKKLAENLVVAQAEVVATALRLIEYASGEAMEENPLVATLERARRATDPPPAPPNPNRVLYATIAITWRVYKLLPAALRRQFNIAWAALRRNRGEQPA